MKTLFLSVIYCLLLSTFFPGSHASEKNENEPFRMRKINLVWQRAKRIGLEQDALNELYVELKRQDRDEHKWKHQKAEGKDESGEMEAVLRRNLFKIMQKYGLEGRSQGKDSSEETGDHIDTNRVQSASFVKDERLEKLWEYAKNAEQFSKEELENLRKELDHHHDKWKQYQELVNFQESLNSNADNDVAHDEHTISKLKEEMSMKQQEIDSNYRKLKRKVAQGAKDREFEDDRVEDLWRKAKAQKLPSDELEILKEELRHFNHRIAKHDDLQEQLDFAEDLLSQGHEHIKAKHDKLFAKVNEHKRYIKKLHSTLEKKIGLHNEL